jgi:hypothetical protein
VGGWGWGWGGLLLAASASASPCFMCVCLFGVQASSGPQCHSALLAVVASLLISAKWRREHQASATENKKPKQHRHIADRHTPGREIGDPRSAAVPNSDSLPLMREAHLLYSSLFGTSFSSGIRFGPFLTTLLPFARVSTSFARGSIVYSALSCESTSSVTSVLHPYCILLHAKSRRNSSAGKKGDALSLDIPPAQ